MGMSWIDEQVKYFPALRGECYSGMGASPLGESALCDAPTGRLAPLRYKVLPRLRQRIIAGWARALSASAHESLPGSHSSFLGDSTRTLHQPTAAATGIAPKSGAVSSDPSSDGVVSLDVVSFDVVDSLGHRASNGLVTLTSGRFRTCV